MLPMPERLRVARCVCSWLSQLEYDCVQGGGALGVEEHALSVLLVELGKRVCHRVTATFVGVFYKFLLPSPIGFNFLAGSLCLFHGTKCGP